MDRYFKAVLIGLIMIAVIGGSLGCRKGILTTTPVDRSLEKVTKTFPTPPPGVLSSPTATESPSSGTPDQVVAGQGVLASRCGACHPGGKAGLGPSLIGYAKTDAEFVATVRQGGKIMPAFPPGQVSDQELAAILAFLRAPASGAQQMAAKPVPTPTPSPTPTAAPSTPAPPPSPGPEGDATAGEVIFSGLCNACHPGGKKGLGPSLVGIGDRSTDEQIISLVRQGRNIMPAFSEGKLSDGQLRDILAFLKALK